MVKHVGTLSQLNEQIPSKDSKDAAGGVLPEGS